MSRKSSVLYTKLQTQNLMDAWKSTEPIPEKGKKVIMCFANKGGCEVDMVEIERTDLKGTYGDRLYRVSQSSKEGREFDQNVQESHVADYQQYLARCLREDNLEKHRLALASA